MRRVLHRWRRWIPRAAGLGVALVLLWVGAAAVLPFPHQQLRQYPGNLRLLDREGSVLRRVLGGEGVDAEWVRLSGTGDWVGAAIVSAEDKRFRQHHGMDLLAVLRALRLNITHGRIVSGASTLSTQVIRLLEPRPRTLGTKLREAFRALQLEQRYSKDEILEQYVNRAPFGGNRVGVQAAALRYYGKPAALLSAGEAALLMGLPQRPSRFRPDRYPERAERRREYVLERMRLDGVLSERPLLDTGRRYHAPPFATPWFADWIQQRGGLPPSGDVRTTLDPGLQALAESCAASAVDGVLDGVAVVILDARSGAVRAMVGGPDYEHPRHGRVNAATRRRSPGSTLKPFAFAAAFQRGWLRPDSRVSDAPRSYAGYQPSNMEDGWDGEVSARDALVRSLNFPALHVVERLGVPVFLQTLRDAGLPLRDVTPQNAGLGAVLGGGLDVNLLDLTAAYTAFANGGVVVPPHGVEGQGTKGRRVFSPAVAFWISDILGGADRNQELYGHFADVELPRLAFKTGTSHGQRDAWAVGWNPEWVLGVWVGRMDGGPVEGLTGLTHAAPLLGRLARGMVPSVGGNAWFSPPQAPRRLLAEAWAPTPVTPLRIVSPAHGSELHSLETNGVMGVRVQALGGGGEPVHWFLNGVWVRQSPVNEPWVAALAPGSHELRAVGPEGSAHAVTVHVRRM